MYTEKKKFKNRLSASSLWTFSLVLSIAMTAGLLRYRYLQQHSHDWDEPPYLLAARNIAREIKQGNWLEALEADSNPEHPPLAKFVYGVGLASTVRDIDCGQTCWHQSLIALRHVAALLGVASVILTSLVNLPAGFILAAHPLAIKYTSEVMLEPVALLFSLLTILAYQRSRALRSKSGDHLDSWALISGTCLGFAASSKFMYAIPGIAVALDILVRSLRHRSGQKIIALLVWGLISILTFFLINATAQSSLTSNLTKAIEFWFDQAELVAKTRESPWESLKHLLIDLPWNIGSYIICLAFVGLWKLFRLYPVFAWWLFVGCFFLVLWPVKWLQYALLVVVPWGVAAGCGISAIAEICARARRRWHLFNRFPSPQFKRRFQLTLGVALPIFLAAMAPFAWPKKSYLLHEFALQRDPSLLAAFLAGGEPGSPVCREHLEQLEGVDGIRQRYVWKTPWLSDLIYSPEALGSRENSFLCFRFVINGVTDWDGSALQAELHALQVEYQREPDAWIPLPSESAGRFNEDVLLTVALENIDPFLQSDPCPLEGEASQIEFMDIAVPLRLRGKEWASPILTLYFQGPAKLGKPCAEH